MMFPRVSHILSQSEEDPQLAPKITGMLINLEVTSFDNIVEILQDQTKLKQRIEDSK
jgi:hypothetical protein